MGYLAFILFVCLIHFEYSFTNAAGDDNKDCTSKEAILEKLLNSYDKEKIPSSPVCLKVVETRKRVFQTKSKYSSEPEPEPEPEPAVITYHDVSCGKILGPAVVDVSILFDDEIDATDFQELMEVDVLIKQSWQDTALNFENMFPCMRNISLDDTHAQQIWGPDAKFLTYGEFEPGIALPVTPKVLTKPFFILKSDGTVLQFERVRVKTFCSASRDNFPFLSQTCTIIYGSLVHNKDEVILRQSISEDSVITQSSNAEHFMIYEAEEWDMITPNGKSSTIKINFSLQKKIRKLIYMFYAPSALIVGISWLTFLLGPLVIARAVTVIGSLILLFVHFGMQSADFPKSTKITAIDAWMLVCVAFVFCAVVELAIVSCMASTRRPRRSRREGGRCLCFKSRRASYSTVPVVQTNTTTTTASDPLYEELNVMKNEKSVDNQRTCTCCRVCALSIDFISFIVFPCLFVVFNFFYWTANDQIMWFFDLL